jgi:hypothetical protein
MDSSLSCEDAMDTGDHADTTTTATHGDSRADTEVRRYNSEQQQSPPPVAAACATT